MTAENLERAKDLQLDIERVHKQIEVLKINRRAKFIQMDCVGYDRHIEVCYDEAIAEKVRQLLLIENTNKLNQLKAEFEAL